MEYQFQMIFFFVNEMNSRPQQPAMRIIFSPSQQRMIDMSKVNEPLLLNDGNAHVFLTLPHYQFGAFDHSICIIIINHCHHPNHLYIIIDIKFKKKVSRGYNATFIDLLYAQYSVLNRAIFIRMYI